MFKQTRRWIAYPLAWLFAMLVPLIAGQWVGSWGATSEVNSFTIDRFDAEYVAVPVAGKLQLRVKERIVANFPKARTNRGIERRLDGRYGDTTIDLDDFEVTDTSGKEVRFSKRTEDGDVILRIGDPSKYVSGTVRYVISYTIGNAMVDAGDRQEIYLDVNGTGWLQPFGAVTATVDVSRVADRLLDEQACYRGPVGSTQPCAITRTGTSYRAEAAGLGPRETMTIAIGLQPATVATAVPLPRLRGLGETGVLAMPAAAAVVLLACLAVRATRRRLGDDDGTAQVQFAPPQDIPAIAAADFLARPDTGVAAHLAELVVQGAATITSDTEPVATAAQDRGRLGLRQARELRSSLQVSLTQPDLIANRAVRRLSERLFGDGRPTALDDVRNSDIADATARRRELQDSLGLRSPVAAPRWLLGVGMPALLVFGWVQLWLGVPGLGWQFLAAGTLAVVLLVAAFHYYPQVGRLTDRGRRLRDHLAGLHRFLTMAEANRIAWLQNAVDAPRVAGPQDDSLVKLYEPLLPYAIIFGVESTWRQLLGAHYDTLPPAPEAPLRASLLVLADLPPERRPRLYSRRDDRSSSWWDSRPGWGEGWIASGTDSLARSWDAHRAATDDDNGGSAWGGSSRSGGSRRSRSSGGSRGRGSSGGGMGGGGGGGW